MLCPLLLLQVQLQVPRWFVLPTATIERTGAEGKREGRLGKALHACHGERAAANCTVVLGLDSQGDCQGPPPLLSVARSSLADTKNERCA